MNFKNTLLDDRLNALLVVAALVMAVFGGTDDLFQVAKAADTGIAVAVAVVPAPLV